MPELFGLSGRLKTSEINLRWVPSGKTRLGSLNRCSFNIYRPCFSIEPTGGFPALLKQEIGCSYCDVHTYGIARDYRGCEARLSVPQPHAWHPGRCSDAGATDHRTGYRLSGFGIEVGRAAPPYGNVLRPADSKRPVARFRHHAARSWKQCVICAQPAPDPKGLLLGSASFNGSAIREGARRLARLPVAFCVVNHRNILNAIGCYVPLLSCPSWSLGWIYTAVGGPDVRFEEVN